MDLDPEVYPYSSLEWRVPTGPIDPVKLREAIRSAPGSIWVIEWKHQPGFLGLVELRPFSELKSIGIAFRLIRSEWGKGIATEAAGVALEYGFRKMKLLEIVALVHPENIRSQRVVQKLGLRWDGLIFVGRRSVLSVPFSNCSDNSRGAYTNKYICYRLSSADYRGHI